MNFRWQSRQAISAGRCGMVCAALFFLLSSINAAQATEPLTRTLVKDLIERGQAQTSPEAIDLLTDEFFEVALGYDGRLLKWRPTPYLSALEIPDDERWIAFANRGKIPELFESSLKSIAGLTGTHWTTAVTTDRIPKARLFLALSRHASIYWRERVSLTDPVSYCFTLDCVGGHGGFKRKPTQPFTIPGIETSFPELEASEQPRMEIANGQRWDGKSRYDSLIGHVKASLFTNKSREMVWTICVARTNNTDNLAVLARSLLLECLARSFGFVGSSSLFPESVLGVRLPERPDIFLEGKESLSTEEYGENLPQELTPFDKWALQLLYDERIEAGMTRDEAEPLVREALAEDLMRP